MLRQFALTSLCAVALLLGWWLRPLLTLPTTPRTRPPLALGTPPKDLSLSLRRPRYPVIDTHTHLHPKGLKQAVAFMDRLGIRVMVNLSGRWPGGGLEQVLRESRRYKGRFVVFTSPDFSLLDEPDGVARMVEALRKAHALGARGLKIHKGLGLRVTGDDGTLLPVDDESLAPLWNTAGELGMPVAIHTGDPKAFFKPLNRQNERYAELSLNPHWSFADRRLYPTWEALYKQFLRLVARHPKTTFIGVHFGNHPEDVVAVGRAMDRHANLWIDLAARLPEIGRQAPQKVREVFTRHQDRILFATDLAIWQRSSGALRYTTGAPMKPPPTRRDVLRYFWRHWTYLETSLRDLRNPTPIQGAWPIHGIQLPAPILQKVYCLNAKKLLKLHAVRCR